MRANKPYGAIIKEDEKTLMDYNIYSGENVPLLVSWTSGKIKIKTLRGFIANLDVKPSDTIRDLTEQMEKIEGVPYYQQKLFYRGRQMDPTAELLKNLSIPSNGAVMSMVVNLRGTAKESNGWNGGRTARRSKRRNTKRTRYSRR